MLTLHEQINIDWDSRGKYTLRRLIVILILILGVVGWQAYGKYQVYSQHDALDQEAAHVGQSVSRHAVFTENANASHFKAKRDVNCSEYCNGASARTCYRKQSSLLGTANRIGTPCLINVVLLLCFYNSPSNAPGRPPTPTGAGNYETGLLLVPASYSRLTVTDF